MNNQSCGHLMCRILLTIRLFLGQLRNGHKNLLFNLSNKPALNPDPFIRKLLPTLIIYLLLPNPQIPLGPILLNLLPPVLPFLLSHKPLMNILHPRLLHLLPITLIPLHAIQHTPELLLINRLNHHSLLDSLPNTPLLQDQLHLVGGLFRNLNASRRGTHRVY
jgi:hypothetical protein